MLGFFYFLFSSLSVKISDLWRILFMVIRLFLVSVVFDFLIWLPTFNYVYQPWAVNLHQSGAIGYGLFCFMSLIASLMPLIFICSLMIVHHYFDTKEPMELKSVKNDKKRLVSVKAN